jgi:hypothetical protein
MAVYTPLADATVEAFQWLGDPFSDYNLPGWASGMALHAPTDQMLHVPCWNGTFAARIGEWVVKGPTGDVNVVPDEVFRASYNADEVDVSETKRTAEESHAIAMEARAEADKQRADNAVSIREARAAREMPPPATRSASAKPATTPPAKPAT